MIENRAVGTNGDINRRKHASQGEKVVNNFFIYFLFYFIFFNLFFFIFIFEKINKNI